LYDTGMVEHVKPRRSYHSPRRQQQAAATRQGILEAAERLFERRGYPATTMEQVAAEAGVALKTVYVAFATKSGLLRALWDLRLKGDQDQAAVAERPWYREVVGELDPERQVRGNAANARVVKQRIGGVLKILRSAAPVAPDRQRLLRQPARDRGVPARQGGAPAGLGCRWRDRHPVGAQPPRRLAAAGRRARLGSRAVGAVVRRHRLRPAAPRPASISLVAECCLRLLLDR